LQVVSVGNELPGVLAVGERATGIFAVGQFAHGTVAIGQSATGAVAIGQFAVGVVAIGQFARGFFTVGMFSLGLVSAGLFSGGVLWSAGFGIGGLDGLGLVYGLLPRPRPRQILAWIRREPWDSTPRLPAPGASQVLWWMWGLDGLDSATGLPPRRAWQVALNIVLLAGLAAAWWVYAGRVAIAALS
jgi:hypothetical protein